MALSAVPHDSAVNVPFFQLFGRLREVDRHNGIDYIAFSLGSK